MGKYIERQAENGDDLNKYCTLFFVADDATEYPVHCGCGGTNFLCDLHKRELLAGGEPFSQKPGLISNAVVASRLGSALSRSSGPHRWPASRAAR